MPVTTRRQSRRLHYSNVIGGQRQDKLTDSMREGEAGDGDDDDPMGGSISELSAIEDEDLESVRDEYESDASEGESDGEESDNPELDDDFQVTPSVAKRRRLEKARKLSSSKSPAKTKRTGISRRVQGRLENMLSLPLDVLFLIFSELEPMDLVNLARTSKSLRRVLMSRKSMSVWMVVRRNAGIVPVPDPPEDMSEPAWALLLFGPSVCSHCSTKNVHRVDFALRRRLCVTCRKRNLVFANQFRSQCPDLKESIMSLLPYTRLGGWAHGRAAGSRFYWKPDLYEMNKKVAELEEARDTGKPGAQQILRSFRAERIMAADAIVESSVELEEWAIEEEAAQADFALETRIQRRKALADRILAAGYDDADIDFIGIGAVPGANACKLLTEDAWRRIKSKVEIALNGAREARQQAERRRREREYKTRVEQYYVDILEQILPIQRLYLPAIPQARELSCFREFATLDRDVQPEEWEQAAGRLLESLSEWMTEHRDKYISMLPSKIHGAQATAMEIKLLTDSSIDLWRQGASSTFAGQLELATSVFRVTGTSTILFGREVCHAWKMARELEFVERGEVAINALLQELQLDPATTTVSTLEQLNKLFVCTSCSTGHDPHYCSWRGYVVHFIECLGECHRLRVVGPEEAVSVDMLHVDSLFPPHETWFCNHCSNHVAPDYFGPISSWTHRFLWFAEKDYADLHVRAEHHIVNPMVDVDVFAQQSLFAA